VLTSEDVNESKRLEAQLEEAKLVPRESRMRKSA
jgi:hypothetical protein